MFPEWCTWQTLLCLAAVVFVAGFAWTVACHLAGRAIAHFHLPAWLRRR